MGNEAFTSVQKMAWNGLLHFPLSCLSAMNSLIFSPLSSQFFFFFPRSGVPVCCNFGFWFCALSRLRWSCGDDRWVGTSGLLVSDEEIGSSCSSLEVKHMKIFLLLVLSTPNSLDLMYYNWNTIFSFLLGICLLVSNNYTLSCFSTFTDKGTELLDPFNF